MKKIKLKTATFVAGKKVKEGATVEAEDRDAYFLVTTGKAEYVTAEDKKAAAAKAKKPLGTDSGLK